jgi:hypothetical protein
MYAGRESGARLVEANGIPEDQIRCSGRWNADQITGYYLTTLLRAFIRGIADFDPEYASSYFLPRETVAPPALLLGRVWPDLDRWQAAYLGRADATEQVEPNLAAGGFLELLQRLRTVFLQVSQLAPLDAGPVILTSLAWPRILCSGGGSFPGIPYLRTPYFRQQNTRPLS